MFRFCSYLVNPTTHTTFGGEPSKGSKIAPIPGFTWFAFNPDLRFRAKSATLLVGQFDGSFVVWFGEKVSLGGVPVLPPDSLVDFEEVSPPRKGST